jgi:hypothetical protein
LVNDKQYFEAAHVLLSELEVVVAEVNRQWPKPLGQAVKKGEATPALWESARKRDILADSVKIFAAMSVEAFLNFYGVLRLGAGFGTSLERLGLVPKLKKLVELCDNRVLTDSDTIVLTLRRISKRRNRLVHPAAREVAGYMPQEDRGGDKVPDVAREAVTDMVTFFEEFGKLQPGVMHHLPVK